MKKSTAFSLFCLFTAISTRSAIAAEAIAVNGNTHYVMDPGNPKAWQIYSNNVEISTWSIPQHAGNAKTAGAYIWINGTSGFGTLTANRKDWFWGCAFSNATQNVIREIELKVAAGQWGGNNLTSGAQDMLYLEYAKSSGECALNAVDEDAWISLADPLFVAQKTDSGTDGYPVIDSSKMFSIPAILSPREALLFRFVDKSPKTGGNAAMGISLFEIDFYSSRGFEISVE